MLGFNPIDNTASHIDSRDLIARIEYLCDIVMTPEMDSYRRDADETLLAEFESLRSIHNECRNEVDEWESGATLIRYDWFTDYVKEYVSEVTGEWFSAIPDYVVIDWDATADNLTVDYTEVEFDGVTYFARI